MEIKDLSATSSATLVSCLNAAFSNYFVRLPTGVDYWETRFKGARVDLSVSCGCFEDDRLVGFIINGIDMRNGKLTAYNSGTGVLSEFRGQGLVDQMYEYILPRLRERGVQKCILEVIQENRQAIRVYERVGFRKNRKLICFSGTLTEGDRQYAPQDVPFSRVLSFQKYEKLSSWDNSNAAIENSGDKFRTFVVRDLNDVIRGYATIDPETGYIAQMESVFGDYRELLNAVSRVKQQVRMNNIDEGRTGLLTAMRDCGLTLTLSQFEMEMDI